MLGTDLLTAKLANQSKHVDIDTPLARTFKGNISGGYNLMMMMMMMFTETNYKRGVLQNLSSTCET
jgi:hypothetical protein